MSNRSRVRTIYSGRVQGVGFRATTASIAARHPITGFVRNEPDGSVLCEAQGAPKDLTRFHADVRAALGGNIRAEATTPIPPVLDEADFMIQR